MENCDYFICRGSSILFLYGPAHKSSNINEGIKAVFFFNRKDFTHTKSTKSTKSTKPKQATLAQMFFNPIKSIKSMKNTKSTKKHKKKRIKSTKTHIGKQATFFPLDVVFKRI